MLAKDVYDRDIEYRYDDDDEDEALSLCDLPIYGDDAAEIQSDDASLRWNQSSSSASSSSNADDDDCFEFSFSSSQSMESCWVSNVHHHPVHENIIFCGKIIPRKVVPLPKKNSATFSSKTMTLMEKSSTVRKISAAPSKPSKWYFLMFGLVRIQGHMELKDIKKRQIKRSRRSTPTTFGSNGGDGEIVKSGEIKGKGMWSFLRAFGPTSPSDVDSKVKASLWCVQQLRAGH